MEAEKFGNERAVRKQMLAKRKKDAEEPSKGLEVNRTFQETGCQQNLPRDWKSTLMSTLKTTLVGGKLALPGFDHLKSFNGCKTRYVDVPYLIDQRILVPFK